MKKRKVGTRILALALAVAMVGSSLTGCGKKDSGTKTVIDKDHVYKAEYFELPEGLDNINHMKSSKDRIYMDGYNTKKGYQYIICSMKSDGTDMKVLYEPNPKEQANVNTFAVDTEGVVCYLKTEYVEDKSDPENIKSSNKSSLVQVDADGKELQSKEIKLKENFSPSDMLIDKEGNILILSYDSLEVFDKNGKSFDSVDFSGIYVDSAFVTEKGQILFSSFSQNDSKREIKEYLPQEKKLSEPIPMEGMINNSSFFAGIGYDFMIRESTDLYGYNIETKEKTKLVNWIDSDVNGTTVSALVPLADGKIIFTTQNYMKNPSTTELAVLTKVKPEDVVDKTILTLAAVYADIQVVGAVIEFNKKSDKYRITIKDYSGYNSEEDYLAASNKLNTDIVSGDVPDLLMITSSDTTSFESFVSKGLFLDINELMKKDKDFDRSQYLENIFAAFEEDGKMYSLVPYFQTFSLVGKTSNVGKEMGWTLSDLKKMVESKPEGTTIIENMTQKQIMQYGTYLCLDAYVDWKKGTCNFDTPEFKELIEFAKQFPKETENNMGMGMGMEAVTSVDGNANEETKYKKDKVLLQENYLYNFSEIHRLQKSIFGEEVTFIGFPTADKNGSALSPGIQLAISSNCKSQDAAWEFAKSFLSDSFQDDLMWGWPTKISSLEVKKQKDQKPQTYTDENGKEVEYEETYIENGKEKKLGIVTDEECDKVVDFIKSLTQVMRYDEKVNTIIEEETGAYFADQKSVDETAKLIQNRIQTYLSEIQ